MRAGSACFASASAPNEEPQKRAHSQRPQHAYATWRREANDEARRAIEAKRREAEDKFAALHQRCAEVTAALTDTEARNSSVRRNLQSALAAGREAVEQSEHGA